MATSIPCYLFCVILVSASICPIVAEIGSSNVCLDDQTCDLTNAQVNDEASFMVKHMIVGKGMKDNTMQALSTMNVTQAVPKGSKLLFEDEFEFEQRLSNKLAVSVGNHAYLVTNRTLGLNSAVLSYVLEAAPQHSFRLAAKLCAGGLALIVIIHEVLIHYIGKSPCQTTNRRFLQFIYLVYNLMLAVDLTALIPSSLSLAEAMNCNALVSGFLISCDNVVCPFGIFLSKHVMQSWPQRSSRKLMVLSLLVCACMDFLFGCVLEMRVHSIVFLIIMRCVNGFVKGVAYAVPFMALKVTPLWEMVTLSMMAVAASNGGIATGPVVHTIAVALAGGDEAVVSGYELAAFPMFLVACLWAALAVSASLGTPQKLEVPQEELPQEQQAPSSSSTSEQQDCKKTTNADDIFPEVLDTSERKNMCLYGLLFNFERGFTIAAIEAATAMFLQEIFGWQTVGIGLAIGLVYAVVVVFIVITEVLRTKKYLGPLMILFGLIGVLLLGSVMFFDFGTKLIDNTPQQILLGNVLVYAGACSANGLIDGFAIRASIPDTHWSRENYMFTRTVAIGIARFAGPPAARGIVEGGGRNTYAYVQLAICAFGCLSVVKVANLAMKARNLAHEKLDSEKIAPAIRNGKI